VPPPERLGRYELGDRIGEGGMGVVFRARITGPEGFSKLVAIKRIHAALARDPGIRDAFVIEALIAQRLHHGNIVQLIDVGLDENIPYLVIEYVDGASLAELLRAGPGRLPIAAALHIAEGVAAALAYAHDLADPAGRPEGLVHRDVTPRNILISRDGVVKLADFGIAKALSAPSYTLPGTFKGSLGYLAPEQARGEPVDARADQFSLGIVLHELLTGENPIAARDVESYHRALASGVPPLVAPAPADAELAAIVARATALDPGARHGSMDELRSELEAWRVARKIRTSGESLRAVMRDRLDAVATVTAPVPARAPRPLGDALRDQLPASVPTQRITPANRAPARGAPARAHGGSRRRVVLAGAGVAALCVAVLGVALLVVGRAPASTTNPAEVPPTPRADAADTAALPPAIDAALAVAPSDAAAPTSTALDAAPAAIARKLPLRPGKLKVMVVPWATVLLDDRPLGGVPIDVEVAAGRHRVTLHNPDTRDRVEKWIEIEPGGLAEVTSW
jgi:hypothetical protein